MQIITLGWGYKVCMTGAAIPATALHLPPSLSLGLQDLAFKKQGSGLCCGVCGCKWGKGAAAEHAHRIAHVKEALEEAHNREKPEDPPMPVLTLKNAPVVISVNPEEDGDAIMTEVMASISERAVKRVKAGKVRSSVVRLSEHTMPGISSASLKGRRIEYAVMIAHCN
jgi:hypothetical protein